jgi:hypothetical protein
MSTRQYTRKTLQERIEKSIYIDPMSGCWLWIAGKHNAGYGDLKRYGKPQERISSLAHRISWEIYRGPIPKGMNVCHHCDIRSCVNPYHLFLGTDKDNMQDALKKGRLRQGEKISWAKLNNEQVMDIRKDHRSQTLIASNYGVIQQTISHIKTGKSWKHL